MLSCLMQYGYEPVHNTIYDVAKYKYPISHQIL